MADEKIKKQGNKCRRVCLAALLLAAALCACRKSERGETEAEEKVFGVDFEQGEAISGPEQVVCGPESAWVITAARDGGIYQFAYDSDSAGVNEISWRQGEAESLINIAQRDGILYAQVYMEEEDIFEIRKYIGGIWLKVTAFKAEEAEWKTVGGGFHVDGQENVYLVSRGKVTRFGEEGNPGKEFRLGGDACFFLEDTQGDTACVALTGKGIALYKLGEEGAGKQWELAVSALRPVGLVSTDEQVLCVAAGEELLFIRPDSGALLARSDLLACGVSSVLGGVYDAQGETLRLYGRESGGNLYCSLLSGRDASAEQRTELVYGTVSFLGIDPDMQAAVMAFNRTNEDYYITVRNYDTAQGLHDPNRNWEDDLLRLHADMAAGNGPDILAMGSNLGHYQAYVKNGYLEDLFPYLEQSPYRDDLVRNVLEGFEVDGGLYLMVPHFAISGVVIHPDYQGLVEEWNMETLFALLEANRWDKIPYNGYADPEFTLESMMQGGLDGFIDWERKEASFETEEFLKLLELCRECGEQEWPDMWEMRYMEQQERTLICEGFLANYTSYLNYVNVYGRECRIYGYPNSSGQTYGVKLREDSCAIYSGSRHKEGAWAFIESLLEDGYQRKNSRYGSFPIRSSILEEKGEQDREAVISVEYRDNELQLTDSEIALMNDLIYNGDFAYMGIDYNIKAVIEEEAAAYFAGDKSAEEVARIIQSRVQLILNE